MATRYMFPAFPPVWLKQDRRVLWIEAHVQMQVAMARQEGRDMRGEPPSQEIEDAIRACQQLLAELSTP